MPTALAITGAAVMFAGAFTPWLVLTGQYGTASENGSVLFVLLAMGPVVWAIIAVRRTPTVIQGSAALVLAFLLLLALWYLTLLGLAGLVATHKKDTGTVGIGFGLANIGCLTLAIAGLARMVQALLIRRARG